MPQTGIVQLIHVQGMHGPTHRRFLNESTTMTSINACTCGSTYSATTIGTNPPRNRHDRQKYWGEPPEGTLCCIEAGVGVMGKKDS